MLADRSDNEHRWLTDRAIVNIIVRGVRLSLEGLFLVEAVTHKLARDEYTHKFRLSREGWAR